MSSGLLTKPAGWSSRDVANRLLTLNRYLKYLPGTALEYQEDDLKDILVAIHPPVYHALLTRANYDVDDHSFAQVTAYLHNPSLLEESLSKYKNQNSSEHKQKAHKKGKKTFTKSKLGKAQCRKHPHHEHTWADCWTNPKNKGKKKPVTGDHKKKEEARNTSPVSMVDSDAEFERELDRELTSFNILDVAQDKELVQEIDEVCDQMENIVSSTRPNTNSPCVPSTTTNTTGLEGIHVDETARCPVVGRKFKCTRKLSNKKKH